MALLGGALADRSDRRRLLLLDQIGLICIAAALCAVSLAGDPSIALLFVLAGLLAGFGALQNVVRTAIVPNLVAREDMPAALAVNFGLLQRFVRRSPALLGSFAIDLSAMTFGMPRALFPVLAISVYGAGASGTGLLFAAVSTGAVVAALTTRWLDHVRRLGVVTIAAVCVWGLAIAAVALVGSLWAAAALLAVAGAADSVSAVCRSVINQTVTPDALRGRMSSVFSLVVTSGPRLGDVEAGAVASLTSPRFGAVGWAGLRGRRRDRRRRVPGACALRQGRGDRGDELRDPRSIDVGRAGSERCRSIAGRMIGR